MLVVLGAPALWLTPNFVLHPDLLWTLVLVTGIIPGIMCAFRVCLGLRKPCRGALGSGSLEMRMRASTV